MRFIGLILVVLGFLVPFLLRLYQVQPKFNEGDRVRITGQVSEDPRIFNGQQRLVVGGIRIFLDRFPQYYYGDGIVAEGVVAKGVGGWYLGKPEVSRVPRVGSLSKALLNLREAILGLYNKFLPQPHSGLLSGMILGTKSGLDFGFYDSLRTTGTLHIIVASGTNVALVGGAILRVFAPILGRRRALVLAFLGIWLYVVLVGFQPPILRAAVMGSIAFTASALGREFDGIRALFISAFALLLLAPTWLFDVGFQLSFAATLGILLFSGRILKLLRFIPRFLSESLATTLGAQIAVSPILFFSFGGFSPLSPLVNTLVLFTVPWIMIGGFFLGALGLVFEPAAYVLSWFVWLLLEYFVRIIELFSSTH